MSDAGSGGRFPFLRRNKNSDTPNAFPQSMDPIAPTTGEIHQVFAPSTPRHAATTSDVTGDFPAMPTSTEGMDEQTERQYAMALAQGMSLPFVDLNEYQIDKEVISMVPDDLCRRNQLLPLSIVNGRIAVAMANPKKFRRGRRCFRNNRHARHRHGRHAIAGTRLHQPVPARQCGVDRTIARDRRDREKRSRP